MKSAPARLAVLAAALLAAAVFLARGQAAEALTISPLDGTPDASPLTQISFLGTAASQISAISVVGSRSGRHAGSVRSYSSATGASFLPAKPFAQGESVSVRASVGPRGHQRTLTTGFVVARLVAYQAKPLPPAPPSANPAPAQAGVQSFASQPGLHPPEVQVTVSSPAQSPGDVFLSPSHGVGQFGPMIIDGRGRLVWFQQAPAGTVATNLQVQDFEGQQVLAWWQGQIVSLGIGFGEDVIYNSSYQPVAGISGGNGYKADLHELRLTPQGSAFITANTIVKADVSSAGGDRNGAVVDSIVQRLDVKTGLVMFEWHALGHVPLYDSHSAPGAASEPFDYFHANSISLDPWNDGNFIVSARNTWTAYEISAHTGAVLWRLGGRRSSFKMAPGTGMAWQHDVRWQPDHTLSIFDDGAKPQIHSQSRVLHERIDWRNRSVNVISRYLHTPALLAGSQGSYQPLANGNSFAGWGEVPYLTEFGPSGQMLFDARLPPAGQSYRAYRFTWSGTPATAPSLALSRAGAALTAYASWNGATEVSAWRILGGSGPGHLSPITRAARSGFETAIPFSSRATWFAVQALDGDGRVLGSSPPAQA